MKNNSLHDIAVVVRASGERTTTVCIQLLEEQVGKIAGLVEGISPFNAASRKSVELAVATGKKYTALVDADVLVSPNSLAKLRRILERATPETFLVNTYTLDKFHLAGREGGIHFYRTNLLAKYLELANEWSDIPRPEAKFHHWMEANGYTIYYDQQITSIHEFFQWRKDVRQKVGYRLQKLGLPQLKHASYLRKIGWLDGDFDIAGRLVNDANAASINDRTEVPKIDWNEKTMKMASWRVRCMVHPWAIYGYIYLQIPLKRLLG
jgi:hypothetical protein